MGPKEALTSAGGAKYAPLTTKWEAIAKNSAPKEVVMMLGKEGWSKQQVESAISGVEKYNVYKKVISPGVGTYLAVPTEGKTLPVQFGEGIPGLSAQIVHAGWLGGQTYTAEQIKKEIVAGIQAAIDALCSMRARPTQIRAQASAFGIVEIEGTWQSGDVCK